MAYIAAGAGELHDADDTPNFRGFMPPGNKPSAPDWQSSNKGAIEATAACTPTAGFKPPPSCQVIRAGQFK